MSHASAKLHQAIQSFHLHQAIQIVKSANEIKGNNFRIALVLIFCGLRVGPRLFPINFLLGSKKDNGRSVVKKISEDLSLFNILLIFNMFFEFFQKNVYFLSEKVERPPNGGVASN